MCFPTPRDVTTDRVQPLFDSHINLSPYNRWFCFKFSNNQLLINHYSFRSQSIQRILESKADYILFADAALDSRVFALAHQRLAMWQGLLWSWGKI
jgi:hypothetical protein